MAEDGVVSGFQVLRIRGREDSKAEHCLFLKSHSVRESHKSKPAGRTLFILNIPPYCNETCLRQLFSNCGLIQDVILQPFPTASAAPKQESHFFPISESHKGFSVAYVVFKKAGGLQKALAMARKAKKAKVLESDEQPLVVGVRSVFRNLLLKGYVSIYTVHFAPPYKERIDGFYLISREWCEEYNNAIPEEKSLLAEVESYMAAFEKKEASEGATKALEEDEEGWVTVNKGARKRALPRTKAMETKVMAKEKRKKRKIEMLNFYSFQMRESKMKELADLRQKFEEDKHRIALVRQARKFRPF